MVEDPSDARSGLVRRTCRELRRAGTAGVALIGLVLGAAACASGSASPDIASLGSTTTTTQPAVGGAASGLMTPQRKYEDVLDYALCMRSHGFPGFPEPEAPGSGSGRGLVSGPNYDTSSPRYKSADNACKHLLPYGGGNPTPAEITALTTQALKFARCMRAHGVPNFPDPTVSQNGSVTFTGLGSQSVPKSQVVAARNACASYQP